MYQHEMISNGKDCGPSRPQAAIYSMQDKLAGTIEIVASVNNEGTTTIFHKRNSAGELVRAWTIGPNFKGEYDLPCGRNIPALHPAP